MGEIPKKGSKLGLGGGEGLEIFFVNEKNISCDPNLPNDHY